MTTKNLIKILPLEQIYKEELLNKFDDYSPNQRFVIEQAIWRTYRTIYQLRLQKNLKDALVAVNNGQDKLDDLFYKRVREKTEKELQTETIQTVEKTDLDAARKAMEQIVHEIQAAKKKK